jgi:hypothetical protein
LARAAFTFRPSFALSSLAGYADDTKKSLFLRSIGVSFEALAHVSGQGPMYW